MPGGQDFGYQLFKELSGKINSPSLEAHGSHGNSLNPCQSKRPPVPWEAELGRSPCNKEMGRPLVSTGLLPKQPRLSSQIPSKKHTPMRHGICNVLFLKKKKERRESGTKTTK